MRGNDAVAGSVFGYSQRQSKSIRVLIVVGVRIYREGLASALSSYEALTLVGVASDSSSALDAIISTSPDVVILDVALGDSLAMMRDLRVQFPATRVIAFAVRQASADIIACAEAGAAGYVPADTSIDGLVMAAVGVVAGELICPPRIANDLFRRIGAQEPQSWRAEATLTARERQVLGMLRERLSNKEIARKLDIAVSTVKNHVHKILEKLEVPSRGHVAASGAGARGVEPGLFPLDRTSRPESRNSLMTDGS
ncbi:MAG: response regulator transcription factor [Rhizobiaceae bacterium]